MPRTLLWILALMLVAAVASAQPPCPHGSVGCKRSGPVLGPSCSEWLLCAFFSLPNDTSDLRAGHYIAVELVYGGPARYSTLPSESIDYTLKYTGSCEASGGALTIQLGGTAFVRLEDKPWNAPCTNLVPLTLEASHSLGSLCGCKLQIPAPPSGPDSCRQGYVWREACGPSDHVCVPPATRDDTAKENELASSRVAPAPRDRTVPGMTWDVCQQGYVWREACGPSDHVCVPPASRTRAKNDNAAASDRVAHFLGQ